MKWDKQVDWPVVCAELKRVCKERAAVLIFSDYKKIFQMHNELEANKLHYKYFFTWDKRDAQSNAMSVKTMPLCRYEYILVFGLGSRQVAYYTDAEQYEGHREYNGAFIYKDGFIPVPFKDAIKMTKEGKLVDGLTFATCKNYDGKRLLHKDLSEKDHRRPIFI